jgi:hypothetical protein
VAKELEVMKLIYHHALGEVAGDGLAESVPKGQKPTYTVHLQPGRQRKRRRNSIGRKGIQSRSRDADGAIHQPSRAVATYGNGSEDAETAYTEAAAAVNEFLEADAALHPPTGASSSSSTIGGVGRGASSLGLETYRAFLKGKGKGGSAPGDGPDRDEETGDEESPDQYEEEYNEGIEEEEKAVADDGEVSVELEVIPEEGDGQEGHEEEEGDPPTNVTEEEAVPEEHD